MHTRSSNRATLTILNQQSFKKINVSTLRRRLQLTLRFCGASKKRISFLLCDNIFIRNLNRRYLHKDSSTDVIAFPLTDNHDQGYLGDVVVSVEKALTVAGRYANTGEQELTLYCIHGILHLLGYDDITQRKRRVMEKKQEEIMKKLKFRSGTPRN